MASAFVEKLQVAAVTATLVSAGWIVAGGIAFDQEEAADIEQEIAAKRQPSPVSLASAGTGNAQSEQDSESASTPPESETATLMIPVLNVAATDLVDTFRDERGGETLLHEALDIAAPEGSTIVAAAPGKVERMFLSDAGGNTVYIRSEDRKTVYYYAHLGEYAPGLNEGQQVRRGQRLGTVGTAGHAAPREPHLHFEIMRTRRDAEWWEPATSVNPYPLLVR